MIAAPFGRFDSDIAMPLQNRVTPEGEIIASPARGRLMGNRGGCLHDENKKLGTRRWVTRAWIACKLEFGGRHREVMAPGGYTELFFLDEATALAAGHRPCFECCRADAVRFAELWGGAQGWGRRARAGEMDRVLHSERLLPGRGKRTFKASPAELPDGTMIRGSAGPALLWGGRQASWTPGGYREPADVPGNYQFEVLTPPGIVAVLKRGYLPSLHFAGPSSL